MDKPKAPSRRVMWSAALLEHDLPTRLNALANRPFTHLSVFPVDMKRWRDQGLTDRDINSMVRNADVDIAVLDPYTGWCPGWSLEGLDEFTKEFIDVSEDDVWRMTEVLETDQVNCVESAGGDYDETAYADALAGFAERAKAHGLRTCLEFMPTSKITDLATGWSLLQKAGDDILMTFDTWHFWRSTPDHDLLATIPGKRIGELQVADGGKDIVEDLQTDLLYHRKIPGDGDFDLQRTISVLDAIGGIRSVGPETFSAEMNELSADEAIHRNGASMDNFFSG